MNSHNKWKIGFIINPIAGMGGAVGLKGSDGKEILKKARELGAEPHAQDRAKEFLKELQPFADHIKFYTVTGVMGGNTLQEFNFDHQIIKNSSIPTKTTLYHTNSHHTKITAQEMKAQGVNLIVFIGGDGTARDIYSAVDLEIPCLGIPGGVKIHSSVFATNPRAAARLIKQYFDGKADLRESEVMDINEAAFRDNRVESKLYGYLKTPYSPLYLQPSKMASPQTERDQDNQDRIAQYIVNKMEQNPDTIYILGPGTTTRAISQIIEQPKTLLGVDLYCRQELIASDLNEQEILTHITGKDVKLVVTPIGAQGFIFGRGNLQLSAKVLFEIGLKNIIIIATKFKMKSLPDGKLRVDSRNPDFDKKFSGLHRIIVDYGELVIAEVIASGY